MDDTNKRLQEIQDKWRQVYEKTIPGKIELLENFIQRLEQKCDLATLSEFRREVHKIAGSAGTVGYMSVSVICKKFDKELLEKIENFDKVSPNQEWIQGFYSYLHLIREGFSSVDT